MRYRIRGQSLVEFALVVPLLVVIVMGIIDFGYYIYTYSELENATRRASEFASKTALNPSNTTCTTMVTDDARKSFILTNPSSLTLNFSYPSGRQLNRPVIVRATYTGTFFTPVARSMFGNTFSFDFSSRRTILSLNPVLDTGNNPVSCS